MAFLKVIDLHKSYRHMTAPVDVLSGVNLELNLGQSLAVVGASGIGKSTLMHCLGLIESVDRGEILFEGQALPLTSREKLVLSRRASIGFVFQHHYLMGELTALENVMVPLMLSGRSKQKAEEEARTFLDRVGLSPRLDHRPSQLSGGEQQRVSIARALCRHPKLILADEPTGNLDPQTGRLIFDLLKEQCENLNAALIMATHNHDLAHRLDRVMKLEKGYLCE